MNRQPRRRSVLHLLLSVLTRKAPEQTKQRVPSPRRPTGHDPDTWHAYWKSLGQAWRTEPEIEPKRQAELDRRRAIVPDIEQGIYPFKGMKLNRADVEWLLATHENGQGPVDWQDTRQRTREGLDLRGVDLRKMDLHNLPLARTRSGLKWLTTTFEWLSTTAEQLEMARIHLEGANLKEAHLEGANLINADLEYAYLVGAYLNEANLGGADLEGAYLIATHLEDANLTGTYLASANLRMTYLHRANLTGAIFDPITDLENAVLGEKELGFASLADISWGGADLTVIDWGSVSILGDERKARQWKPSKEKATEREKDKERQQYLKMYQIAVRANRQLAAVLQTQGLNEDGARFVYRAQILQRVVLRQERKFGQYLFSIFLDLLAGYGYKPGRSFLAYLLVIGTFMALYLLLDPHLAWYEAVVVSLTAFHGRGFSPSTFSPGDPLSIASAVEAFVGLIIEVTFIATLTRRFFGQ